MTWVVCNTDSGYSDESMRFEDAGEAAKFIVDNIDPDYGNQHAVRYESDSEHPQNQVAVGQVNRDGGGWMDYARDTPDVAVRWARREPVGQARVVDWISRQVIWPVPELEDWR